MIVACAAEEPNPTVGLEDRRAFRYASGACPEGSEFWHRGGETWAGALRAPDCRTPLVACPPLVFA